MTAIQSSIQNNPYDRVHSLIKVNNTLNQNQKKNESFLELATEDTEEKFKSKDVSLLSVSSLDESSIKAKILKLKQWENHVIAHEQAHMMVGGAMVGAPSYTYAYGPDGKKYIAGGEVSFHLPVGASLETGIEALKRLKAAATASSDASPADLKAAATAASLEISVNKTLVLKQAKESYERWRSSHLEQLEDKGAFISPISKFKFVETRAFELFI